MKHFVGWGITLICEIPVYMSILLGKYMIFKLREEADTPPNTLLTLSHILRRRKTISNSPWLWKIIY